MPSPAKLTPFAATSMVIANMIGVGVFTSVGFQLEGLPSAAPILVLWMIGGVLSLCGALCYAELVAMMPRSGGEYHLLREGYHPMVGFMAGWISLVAGFSAPIALAASAFAKYAQAFGLQIEGHLLGAALVTLMTAMNLANDTWFGRFLGGMTMMKVLLILAFIAGAIFLPGGVHNDLMPKAGDQALYFSPVYAVSLVYVMYAFEGWNGAAYVAGEVQDPQRNMPRALILGTVVVTLLYLALNAVFLWRAPWAEMQGKEEAALIAAKSIFGQTGGTFMGFLIAFGLISTVASMICAGSRVNERMGEDVSFLRKLSYQNKAGTPVVSVLVVAGMSLIMLFTQTFAQVLRYVECLLLMSSCLAVLSVIWLRLRRPDAPRPFRVPFYPITPLLFAGMIIYMIWFMARQHPQELLWGLATLGLGLVVYLVGTWLHQGKTLATRE